MAIRTFYGWPEIDSEGRVKTDRVEASAAAHGGKVVTKEFEGRTCYGFEFAEGCVLSTSSRETRVMSDVWGTSAYAMYWDAKAGRPVEFVYALYCDVSAHFGSAEVDATPEVKEFHEAFIDGRARGYGFAAAERAAAEEEEAAAERARMAAKAAEDAARKAEIVADDSTPRVGDVVEVTRGNKSTAKGTTGRVFWTGWSNRGGASWRIGFKDGPGETHWIAATGVKVVEKGTAPRAVVVPPETFAAPKVGKGEMVVITAGEGEGVVGWVIWVGSDRRTGAPRVGVKDYGGEVIWTAAANVAPREKAA